MLKALCCVHVRSILPVQYFAFLRYVIAPRGTLQTPTQAWTSLELFVCSYESGILILFLPLSTPSFRSIHCPPSGGFAKTLINLQYGELALEAKINLRPFLLLLA